MSSSHADFELTQDPAFFASKPDVASEDEFASSAPGSSTDIGNRYHWSF
jgi:hypothetical protein